MNSKPPELPQRNNSENRDKITLPRSNNNIKIPDKLFIRHNPNLVINYDNFNDIGNFTYSKPYYKLDGIILVLKD